MSIGCAVKGRIFSSNTDNGSMVANRFWKGETQTQAEKHLYEAMKGRGLEPFPQYKFGIGGEPFRVDFGFPKRRVAVECDGRHHQYEPQLSRDEARDKTLWRFGWRVIRLQDSQIFNNVNECIAIIQDEIAAVR